MGFDEETGDGHRVYWAEKRSITVGRSVRFNFEEEVVVGQLPLEGENSTSEPKTSQTAPIKTTTIKEVVEPAVGAEVPEVSDHLGEEFEDEQPAEGRGKRIRKESAYTRRLRDGEGVTTGLPSATILPKGLPQVQEEREVGDLADDADNELFEWDIVDVEREFAMTMAIEGAEGLNPSFEEVRKRADWPRLCIKKNAAGKVEKYKAHLVAKGFTQIYGVDF